MTEVLQLDYYLFELINTKWSNVFFDFLLPIIRNKYTWLPVYLFLIAYLVLNHSTKGMRMVIVILLTVAAADIVSSSILKPLVERSRPCQLADATFEVRKLVHCGSGKSFTSSHAANHTALSFILIFLIRFRKRIWPIAIISWALLIGYAQVYVGVHFPFDVIGGIIVGSLVAQIGFYIAKRWDVCLDL